MPLSRRLALSAALLCCHAPLWAQTPTYPDKPVRVIVPFAPGGPADVLARLVGQELHEMLGQPLIIENRAGAAGNIGVAQLAKAAPDGYTLGVVPIGNVVVNPSLYATLPYKVSDLQPVAMMATVENILVVNASVPVRSVKELLALAKSKPEAVSFASPGAGSQSHLAGELLALDGHVHITHVPYKGMSPALNDVISGQVTMMFASASAALPFIKSGRLRALGLASLQRSPGMPDVPTIAEQGLPDFEAVSWYALMAPAAMPKAMVDRLNTDVARVLERPEVKSKVAVLGFEPGAGKPQEIAARIQSEAVRWSAVVKKKNITVD